MMDRPTDLPQSRFGGGPPPPLHAYLDHNKSLDRGIYAGFWQRFFASFIDAIALLVVNGTLVSVLGYMFERAIPDSNVWLDTAAWGFLNVIWYVLFDWLYYAGMESSAWQATLGKRALGIIVTDLDHNRISFWRATGRFFARYISAFILLIGYLIQPFTTKRQALHDIIAGTLVVRI